MTASISDGKRTERKPGLGFWMDQVLEECDRAAENFAPDPVHDLRVALRRCRSMADGLRAIDPDPAWKQMKKAGKQLFSSLGDLRDVQVMEEWAHQLDSPGDPVTSKLLEFFALREIQLKHEAAQALQKFDRKQWRKWSRSLPRRTGKMRPGSAVFKHLALEHWMEAHALHRHALRNRSQAAWHRLRIGLKRLRYIVENFLPEQHAAWGSDLKKLQDLLGEVHDFDVLWATAQKINAFPTPEDRARWHTRIREERNRRIEEYRDKMLGPAALWQVWRESLPQGGEIEAIGLQRLRLWASFLDADPKHSNHAARLSLQLYDGLAGEDGRAAKFPTSEENRQILRLAALLHDVGRSRGEKKHQKTSYGLMQRLTPPLGVSRRRLHMAAAVARYHRGAAPQRGQKAQQGLSPAQRQVVLWLAAILRLANGFDSARDQRINKLEVGSQQNCLVITAQGYSARDRLARTVAGERYLLELALRRPILVKPPSVARTRPERSRMGPSPAKSRHPVRTSR